MDPDAAAAVFDQFADLIAEKVAAKLSHRAAATKPASVPAQAYLSTKEAAQRLGMTAASLAGLRARGKGPPFVRVGKLIRYRLTDLP